MKLSVYEFELISDVAAVLCDGFLLGPLIDVPGTCGRLRRFFNRIGACGITSVGIDFGVVKIN
jgi:hypothetical protein